MEQDRPVSPAALLLTVSVARRYYLDGASKSEIAAEHGLSRFKVARLLDQARSSGIVRVEVEVRGEINVDLSLRLRTAFGLRHAIVIDEPGDDEPLLRESLGRVAAELLGEIVEADDVLGLVWARSLLAMRSSLEQMAPCTVVQLTGALARPDVDESSVELVRDVARIGGGPAFCFYAPMILPDATTAQGLRAQPDIARALDGSPRLTKAVVGIGAWETGLSTVADAMSERERREMHELGVRAEIGGIQLDADGAFVTTSLTERMIGIDFARLRAVEEVIAIVYGVRKADAVRAALRGGLVTSLVTHAALATELLEHT